MVREIWWEKKHFIMPLLKKEGHIALHVSVGLPHFVQLITQECFASEDSNLVGR